MHPLPPPYANKESGILHAVIETPQGSRNKYNYDEKTGLFFLKRVLPAGGAFPLDFGFIPGTLAEDGDPLDVLLLSDAPGVTGSYVRCRPVGIMNVRQREPGGDDFFRNDRIIAVTLPAHQYASVESASELDQAWLDEIGAFFAAYHHREGGKVELLGIGGVEEAQEAVRTASTVVD